MRIVFTSALLSMLLLNSNGHANDSQGINIPNRSANRIACTTIKALEKHIKSLPDANAIRDQKRNPITDGCVWLSGKGLFPLGQPAGWLFSGDYLFLVNGLQANDGQKFLHPSVVVDSRDWRLEDECSKASFWKSTLLNGEKYRFFGVNSRKGFDPFCINLVNKKSEADILNKPPFAYSKNWMSRPFWRTMVSCPDLGVLSSRLDTMTNEMQVSNSDRATFGKKGGCSFRSIDEIIASRFVGLYQTVPGSSSSASFIVEIHAVAHLDKRSDEISIGYMPTTPIRSKLKRLEGACARAITLPNEGVRLLGARIGNVENAKVKTTLGERLVQGESAVPIGDLSCVTEDIVYRR